MRSSAVELLTKLLRKGRYIPQKCRSPHQSTSIVQDKLDFLTKKEFTDQPSTHAALMSPNLTAVKENLPFRHSFVRSEVCMYSTCHKRHLSWNIIKGWRTPIGKIVLCQRSSSTKVFLLIGYVLAGKSLDIYAEHNNPS